MATGTRDVQKDAPAEGSDRNWRVGETRGKWKCVMNDYRGQEFVGFTPNSEIFAPVDLASPKK